MKDSLDASSPRTSFSTLIGGKADFSAPRAYLASSFIAPGKTTLLLLQCHDLGYAALMATAAKCGFEERLHDGAIGFVGYETT